jgi:hypothetical protein
MLPPALPSKLDSAASNATPVRTVTQDRCGAGAIRSSQANGLKLSRKGPVPDALDQTKRARGACLRQTLLSRQRFGALVGSNFELGSQLAHCASSVSLLSRVVSVCSSSHRLRSAR